MIFICIISSLRSSHPLFVTALPQGGIDIICADSEDAVLCPCLQQIALFLTRFVQPSWLHCFLSLTLTFVRCVIQCPPLMLLL